MDGYKGWRQAILGLLASVLSFTAQALCTTVPTSPAGFGTVSSILVRTTSQPASTTNAGLSCTGSLLSILASNDHFYATITSTTSGMVGPTGDVISYTLYANNSTSYPITRGCSSTSRAIPSSTCWACWAAQPWPRPCRSTSAPSPAATSQQGSTPKT